jgi:hypothetical protein
MIEHSPIFYYKAYGDREVISPEGMWQCIRDKHGIPDHTSYEVSSFGCYLEVRWLGFVYDQPEWCELPDYVIPLYQVCDKIDWI